MQRNVLEYLDNSAKRYPNKIAFSDVNGKYTFKKVNDMAKSIASGIVKNVVDINRPIIVLVDRNVESIISFMAVLYSGNFYVPLDKNMPKKRLQDIVVQLEPSLIICSKTDKNIIDNLEFNVKTLVFDEYKDEEVNEEQLTFNRSKILDIDPVYVIFTSGSTGKPKGIVISHRGVIDLVEWLTSAFKFSKKDILGNQTPFYFDASVKDIYLTLKNAMTMHILPKTLFMFPVKLIEFLNENKINVILWATSAMNLVANSKVFDVSKPKYLKKVFFAGEVMHAKILNEWQNSVQANEYVNLYGPTEVTVDCTYYKIDKIFHDEEEIPIGKACENKQIILLDENLKEVDIGQTGEICVRGMGLAKGYYNDPERTEKAFIQNPNNPYYTDIIYRTGDIGVKNEDGYIFFKSRKDDQIKHMGYRIELGDIENAINSCATIKTAICFYDEDEKKIVCVYEGEIEGKEVNAYISESIPKYMYPNIYIKVDKIQYNANGKIDRVRIKENYFDEKNK